MGFLAPRVGHLAPLGGLARHPVSSVPARLGGSHQLGPFQDVEAVGGGSHIEGDGPEHVGEGRAGMVGHPGVDALPVALEGQFGTGPDAPPGPGGRSSRSPRSGAGALGALHQPPAHVDGLVEAETDLGRPTLAPNDQEEGVVGLVEDFNLEARHEAHPVRAASSLLGSLPRRNGVSRPAL